MYEFCEQEISDVAGNADGVEVLTECQAGSMSNGAGKLRICAWCRRVHLRKHHWVDGDAAPYTLQIIAREMLDQATHGVCPDCFNAFLSKRQKRGVSSATAGASQFASALA